MTGLQIFFGICCIINMVLWGLAGLLGFAVWGEVSHSTHQALSKCIAHFVAPYLPEALGSRAVQPAACSFLLSL